MAVIKRQHEDSLSVRAKRAKVQKLSQQTDPIKSLKSPKIKRPALPSPDDSSAASGDAANTPSGGVSFDRESKAAGPKSEKKPSSPNIKAGKTSTSASAEGFLNSESLHKTLIRRKL